MDFAQVKGMRIPGGEVKYIVGHNQQIHQGDGKALLWRRPNEFPYVIGAYTLPNSREYFSGYYIEKYYEPVLVKATYLPTFNENINVPVAYLMASNSLVGTLLNGYYCENENDCQNLHIPSKRKYLANIQVVYWYSLDAEKKKILAYASKGQAQMTIATPYPQHIDGAPTYLKYQYTPPIVLGNGFPIPYGEYYTPDLCRVLDTTTPLVTIRHENGQPNVGYGYWSKTNKITAVREDYSDLIEQYDKATSGAYPKSEYPYLDGVTELGFQGSALGSYATGYRQSQKTFAFYLFFRVAR